MRIDRRGLYPRLSICLNFLHLELRFNYPTKIETSETIKNLT